MASTTTTTTTTTAQNHDQPWTNNDNRRTRRNLIALWDGQPWKDAEERKANMAQCDRIMIALYRFQTEGKVAYRRLVGMHGGGGGTSCNKFRKILSKKVDKDIVSHTGYKGDWSDGGMWPGAVPNATPSKLVDRNDPSSCFLYVFCWHSQPEFLLWHRCLMAEFERGLQDHDPKYGPNDKNRHNGPDAIAAPYWSWEGWDGLSLPQPVANPYYVLKTDEWKDQGYPMGSIFRNPFYRWLAPVCLEAQRSEYFPSILSDDNTTIRASAFTDFGAEFTHTWNTVSVKNNPSMYDVVQVAMQNPNWLHFCTTNPDIGGSILSIENAHNQFHNHIGGRMKGGIKGPGEHKFIFNGQDKDYYTGTMAQNQSSFDPIFFLHHGNVERQFCSWQRRYASKGKMALFESVPSDELMDRILYPWTKPELLFNGKLSWNTESCKESDASFRDWWPLDMLPYKYDEYLEPVDFNEKIFFPLDIKSYRMKVFMDKGDYKGGQYYFYFTPKSTGVKDLIGHLGVLSGSGGTCAQCSIRLEGCVAYKVSDTFENIADAKKAFENGELSLIRNDVEIKITRVEVESWNSSKE